MTPSDTPLMKEISHTPPTGDSVTNVWSRGRKTDVDTQATDTPPAADD